ncbi:hypothetical protein VPH35_082252 [Triticum aestivum]
MDSAHSTCTGDALLDLVRSRTGAGGGQLRDAGHGGWGELCLPDPLQIKRWGGPSSDDEAKEVDGEVLRQGVPLDVSSGGSREAVTTWKGTWARAPLRRGEHR